MLLFSVQKLNLPFFSCISDEAYAPISSSGLPASIVAASPILSVLYSAFCDIVQRVIACLKISFSSIYNVKAFGITQMLSILKNPRIFASREVVFRRRDNAIRAGNGNEAKI